jgi:hypothetical protein
MPRRLDGGACSLLWLLGHDDIRQAVLLPDATSHPQPTAAALGLVDLWRARRVCVQLERWCTAVLEQLDRPLVVGGDGTDGNAGCLDGVEALNLGTMRWETGDMIAVPPLPMPLSYFALAATAQGQVTVIGGSGDAQFHGMTGNYERYARNRDSTAKQALRWRPGSACWEALPSMQRRTRGAAPVALALAGGRTLVAGGRGACYREDDGLWDERVLADVDVLAADGRQWSSLAPMAEGREGALAGLLPGGHVIVAGGYTNGDAGACSSVELWSPGRPGSTGAWRRVADLRRRRDRGAGCVLPSGRFAVLGGVGVVPTGELRFAGGLDLGATELASVDAYDPARREWEPLPDMPAALADHGAAAVLGGMVVVGGGGRGRCDLFDECSGRWYQLPYPLCEPRHKTAVVTVPAAVLAACTARSGAPLDPRQQPMRYGGVSAEEARARQDREFWISCVHDTQTERDHCGCDLMTFRAMTHDNLRMRSYERDIYATTCGKRVLEVRPPVMLPQPLPCRGDLAHMTGFTRFTRSPGQA